MAISCLIRRCSIKRRKDSHTYDKVNHELDDEEIEFKNMIEGGGFDFGEFEQEVFEDSKEDLTFDAKDKSHLNMLERLRNNLVASAKEAGKMVVHSDEEASDNERIRI